MFVQSQQVSLSNCLEKIQQVLASDSESVDTKHPLRGISVAAESASFYIFL